MDRIIAIASQPDSIILDFFAGSGTTGHAVLAHNAAHSDSRRKFILCTNNENNICRNVTYERIKRVIEREGYAAKGIGRGVNQLAVLCNMGKLREVHLGETWQALGEIYGKLRELTERETR